MSYSIINENSKGYLISNMIPVITSDSMKEKREEKNGKVREVWSWLEKEELSSEVRNLFSKNYNTYEFLGREVDNAQLFYARKEIDSFLEEKLDENYLDEMRNHHKARLSKTVQAVACLPIFHYRKEAFSLPSRSPMKYSTTHSFSFKGGKSKATEKEISNEMFSGREWESIRYNLIKLRIITPINSIGYNRYSGLACAYAFNAKNADRLFSVLGLGKRSSYYVKAASVSEEVYLTIDRFMKLVKEDSHHDKKVPFEIEGDLNGYFNMAYNVAKFIEFYQNNCRSVAVNDLYRILVDYCDGNDVKCKSKKLRGILNAYKGDSSYLCGVIKTINPVDRSFSISFCGVQHDIRNKKDAENLVDEIVSMAERFPSVSLKSVKTTRESFFVDACQKEVEKVIEEYNETLRKYGADTTYDARFNKNRSLRPYTEMAITKKNERPKFAGEYDAKSSILGVTAAYNGYSIENAENEIYDLAEKNVYDRKTLKKLFHKAGFSETPIPFMVEAMRAYANSGDLYRDTDTLTIYINSKISGKEITQDFIENGDSYEANFLRTQSRSRKMYDSCEWEDIARSLSIGIDPISKEEKIKNLSADEISFIKSSIEMIRQDFSNMTILGMFGRQFNINDYDRCIEISREYIENIRSCYDIAEALDKVNFHLKNHEKDSNVGGVGSLYYADEDSVSLLLIRSSLKKIRSRVKKGKLDVVTMDEVCDLLLDEESDLCVVSDKNIDLCCICEASKCFYSYIKNRLRVTVGVSSYSPAVFLLEAHAMYKLAIDVMERVKAPVAVIYDEIACEDSSFAEINVKSLHRKRLLELRDIFSPLENRSSDSFESWEKELIF